MPARTAIAVGALYRALDRTPMTVQATESVYDKHRVSPLDDVDTHFSILARALSVGGEGPVDAAAAKKAWALVLATADEDPGCGAAIASLVGLAIGDAVGHAFEFSAIRSDQPADYDGGVFPADRPHLEYIDAAPHYVVHEPLNRFELEPGQWTDDCSMALCLADSLLCCEGYHGGDARLRWHKWWHFGYNNAFRFDDGERDSVGLGGNIAASLEEVGGLPDGTPAHKVPPYYSSRNEDAGNGSIMRLAPIPIYFRGDLEKAMHASEEQSRATHPGSDASACCRFMTYFIAKAIAMRGERGSGDINHRQFITDTIDGFLKSIEGTKVAASPGMKRLESLLRSDPPSPTEVNWDWKKPTPEFRNAIANRQLSSPDGTYNGYPVIPTYWGAYCMDGLAIALWGQYHSDDFATCIRSIVNLHGDADTTAAIAGQMAGAMFGWDGVLSSPQGRAFVDDLKQWDPYAEIGLRAAMLYHCGDGRMS